ncbi:MAG: alpha-ribazole phosphatase [Tannerella sp.]|jgi:alpha-ribazole phosphatase|nr:alpha-ribazole phosphatase [Tannerella sp.]
MEIYMIRHTAVDVPFGVCYGQTDVPLKESFEEEANIVKNNLKDLSFDACFTSPLSRCTKLATYCGYSNATYDNRLKELNFGDWEMQEFNRIYDPRLEEWFKDYLHVTATNGESFEQLHARVAHFLDELKTKAYERVAIFAHGGVLIAAQVYAGLVEAKDGFQNLTPYGGMIKLEL